MATVNDPRAAGFDAAAFRDAIEFSQRMGMPEKESERVKFVFVASREYGVQDPEGNPYDWTASPESVTGEDKVVEVPVAMEFISRSSQARDTSLGYMLPSHAEIYILDTYIDEVRGANHVLVDDNVYEINAWLPPVGLFDVTIHPVLCEARDES